MNKQYKAFLASKQQLEEDAGFDPKWMPDWLYPFQRDLVRWAVVKGRAAIFADCGLGKTPMQLVWAENVIRHTSGSVLILTPLAVSHQTLREASKFDIQCYRSQNGQHKKGITVTNYQRLQHFNPSDFIGVVCDESSCLKNAKAATRKLVTEFMRKIPYRLLCTATAAPNDHHELGTSSEALGYLGYQDMLTRFFKEDTIKDFLGWGRKRYRFKGHAEEAFWRWVASWARACRRPSDLGHDDGDFVLPPLREVTHEVECSSPSDGLLFAVPARSLQEQRAERRDTISASKSIGTALAKRRASQRINDRRNERRAASRVSRWTDTASHNKAQDRVFWVKLATLPQRSDISISLVGTILPICSSMLAVWTITRGVGSYCCER
jgi:hypothetical protein